MLQETSLELVGIMDDGKAGELFFGRTIRASTTCTTIQFDAVVVTSYVKLKEITHTLAATGVDKRSIWTVFPKDR